jgi:hypothetical protein
MKRVVWLLLAAGAANAAIVDIAWNAQGRFTHEGRIEPGKFAEVCGKVAPGQDIQWRYEASAALEFNIHYHVGKNVKYPLRTTAQSADGELRVASSEDHCWMWVNKGDTAAVFKLALSVR